MPLQEDMVHQLLHECHQFKQYFRFVNAHEILICLEILQLIYKRNLIEVFPNYTTILKNLYDITNNELQS
jgi:hypothetical protein